MNSDESKIRTVVRLQIPHENDDKFTPSEYFHSQLWTCVKKGKYNSMKCVCNFSNKQRAVNFFSNNMF